MKMKTKDEPMGNRSRDLSAIISCNRPLGVFFAAITDTGRPVLANKATGRPWVAVLAQNDREALIAARDVIPETAALCRQIADEQRRAAYRPMPLDDFLALLARWDPTAQFADDYSVWYPHAQRGRTLARHSHDSADHRAAYVAKRDTVPASFQPKEVSR